MVSAIPMQVAKCASSHAIHLITPRFEARCHRLSSTGAPDEIVLEGDVHLIVHGAGEPIHLHAQRIVLHMKGGVLSLLGGTVPIPHHSEVGCCNGSQNVQHAVHFVTPCQERMPRESNQVGRGMMPKVEDFDPKPRW